MDRHLFKLSYGRLSHEGRIVKETAKTFTVERRWVDRFGGGMERVFNSHVLKTSALYVVETEAPAAVVHVFSSVQDGNKDYLDNLHARWVDEKRRVLAEAFEMAGIKTEGMSPTETET